LYRRGSHPPPTKQSLKLVDVLFLLFQHSPGEEAISFKPSPSKMFLLSILDGVQSPSISTRGFAFCFLLPHSSIPSPPSFSPSFHFIPFRYSVTETDGDQHQRQ
jgi:hypothetical protein